MSLPSLAEVEHADWPTLKRLCADLGLNPRGRSAVVRMRVLDHVRRRTRRDPWRAGTEHQAPALTRLGFPEAAIRLWESTIRLDAPSPWVGLGAAHLAAGELEEAAKTFDRAAQMGDAPAHLHHAEVLAAGGAYRSAVEACDAYLATRPGDLRGMALKAGYLIRGGWADEAAAVMKAAHEMHPDARELWRGLGNLLLKSGRHEAAAEAYHEAVRADARDVDAWINLGTARLLAGRHREAVGAYREALEIDPTREEALNNLGVAYLKSGQTKSALVNLERAAKHLETAQILLNLAHACEAARLRTEALHAYDRVLRLRPGNTEAAAGRKRLAPRAPAKPRSLRPRRAPRRRARPRIRTKKARRAGPRVKSRRASRRRKPRSHRGRRR